jgi:hypothetical protein
MIPLKGRSLLTAVTTITSLGFLMIGFDNGLMGGFGTSFISPLSTARFTDNNSHRASIRRLVWKSQCHHDRRVCRHLRRLAIVARSRS